jgi:hypothetical protein
VHDAIALEKQGISTVTVCTDGFLAGGRMQAKSLGMHQYPLLCVPQNYITHAPQAVRALAEAALEEVLKRLVVAD